MICPLCVGDNVLLNFGAMPCSLSSFNVTTEIPALQSGGLRLNFKHLLGVLLDWNPSRGWRRQSVTWS